MSHLKMCKEDKTFLFSEIHVDFTSPMLCFIHLRIVSCLRSNFSGSNWHWPTQSMLLVCLLEISFYDLCRMLIEWVQKKTIMPATDLQKGHFFSC